MQQMGMRQSMHNATRGAELKSHRTSRQTVRRIMEFGKPHLRLIIAFVIVSVVIAVLAVATPVLAGRVVNAIVGGTSERTVIILAITIAVIASFEAGLGLAARWLSSRIGEGLIYDLRTTLYGHVQDQPIAFFLRTRTGSLVSRLNNDVIGAQRAFASTLSGLVSNLVMLALTLGVMVSISWQITLLAVLLLPVFLIPAQRMGRVIARYQREAANANAEMGSRMTERFNAGGATLVKLYGDPAGELKRFAHSAGVVRDVGVKTTLAQTSFMISLTLVSSLALALVYGLGGWYALRGSLEPGAVVSLALLLTRLYQPLTALAGARVDVMSAVVSFERVFEVLDLEPILKEAEHPVDIPAGPVAVAFNDVRFSYPTAEKVSLPSLEEGVEFQDRSGEEILHGISFQVDPGKMVALVGSSGAGKSTISQLVPRLYDVDSGAVTIGGVDVRQASTASVRETVGVVTQDGHMFHEPLRENLVMAKTGISDEQIWQVLERVRLGALVRALPEQLDTVVGERGYRFSGGERQRLAIARLLLAEPQVVILDEATSSLDSTSEVAVQHALGEALHGRTALVIAHRLSTIRAADEILVIEAGLILERGTHDELLGRGGRYAELYNTQFSDAHQVQVVAEASV